MAVSNAMTGVPPGSSTLSFVIDRMTTVGSADDANQKLRTL
jgi:hypothetical protein